jgi:hypothetical protein
VSLSFVFLPIFSSDLPLRYFSNETSFKPSHVELNTGLTSNLTHSAFYAVRFAGLLRVGSADRYTFSYSAPKSQPSSLFLSVDGVQLSKLQADGYASVLACSLLHYSFCLCHSPSLTIILSSDLPEHFFGNRPIAHFHSRIF